MKKTTGLIVLALVASGARANWNTTALPNSTVNYNIWGLGHADDGTFIYGENGTFHKRNAFGSDAYTTYAASPTGSADPSFISTAGGSLGVVGSGGFGASELLTFDPSNPASAFAGTGVSLQNYAGHAVDANGAYIIGGNGTSGSNNLTYVALDGTLTQTLINDISQYSCGFAIDAMGNLYVGDNDDGAVYFFSQAQLGAALGGAALEISDGAFVANFGSGGNMGSLAVDGNGVLWGAGWAANGITSFDPGDGTFHSWTPGHDTTHYIVDTFSVDDSSYVGFVSADGFLAGSEVRYGFANADAVPEPGTISLMLIGCGGLVWFRGRRRFFFRG